MADEPKEPGGLTSKADVNKERVSEVSNVSRTINEMQKKVDQKVTEANLNIGDYEKIEEVQSSMIKVLNVLSDTVGKIGTGFKQVAIAVPAAGKEALQQYGSAVAKDISYNKQNVVAMALSRTSPLFGYFASKFMETDVFKTAASKMKANLGAALGGVASKFKAGIGGLFSKSKKKELSTIDENDANPRNKKRGVKKTSDIPKMAKGGFVERAGLAYLHPAEIVVPIDKILGKIDDSISTTRELAMISKKAQLKSLAKMDTYVAGVDHLEKVGMFKGFIRALGDVQTRHTQPANVRMLRAVLSIQDKMGAQIGTWSQVYQKMLVTNPFFRNMMFSLKGLTKMMGTPVKLVYQAFKSRGGYQGHLSKSSSPMEAAAENIGLVYTEGMWRLDNIALFTRATAEATRDLSSAMTGKKYKQLEGVGTGKWSLIGFARTALNFTTEKTVKAIGGLEQIIHKQIGTPKDVRDRLKEENLALAETLTQDREFFVTTWLNKLQGRKEQKGVYGEGGMVESELSTGASTAIQLSNLITLGREQNEILQLGLGMPASMVDAIEQFANKETKEIPLLAEEILQLKEINQEQNSIQEEHLATSDIIGQTMELMADNQDDWHQEEKKQFKKDFGLSKDLIEIENETLDITKKMNFRQKMKSIFGAIGGAFSVVKSLFGLLPAMIPFLLGGGIGKWVRGFLGASIKLGLKNMFKGTIFATGIKSIAKMLGWKGGSKVAEKAAKVAAAKAAKKAAKVAAKKAAKVAAAKATKVAATKAAKAAATKGAKGAAVAATKGAVTKGATKGLAKLAGKTGLKVLVKKIPFIGLLASIGFAAHRIAKGDFVGAGLEVASGAASIVPGLGTAASIAIDAGLIGRDIAKSKTPQTKSIEDKFVTPPNKLKDKGSGIISDSSEMAKKEAVTTVATTKIIVDELQKQGVLNAKGNKEMTDSMSQGFHQNSTSVSNSVSNINTVNANNGSNQPMLSGYTQGLLRGDMLEV